MQWPFWTPWVYHQVQGPLSRSFWSVALEGRASLLPGDCVPPHSTEADTGINSGAGPGIELEVATQDEHGEPEGQEGPVPPKASSSSSPDEAVAGTSSAPVPMVNRAHQQLLQRVAQNLGLLAEEVVESVDPHGGHFDTRGPLKGGTASRKNYPGYH